ncbi:hypothetical protein [Geofilum rubicundum]|uniref:Uncharacterized protein n=1 Tax=Geofilum rubicundum JCM 15548 TaxID=1236989 RepID=A0A0E9LVJ0_9BACT|nr:hypothetical protein [Geofilum rubicundum]GAO29338.1 hypothetical protein JCM15548_11513 [Geofilum rubicundum JCM 15548]
MRKFISPVLFQWIKVASLLLVFVVLLHNSRDGKNPGSDPQSFHEVHKGEEKIGSDSSQVDEPAETETSVAYSYVLPAIAIGSVRLRF